jgi:hypothetical protein
LLKVKKHEGLEAWFEAEGGKLPLRTVAHGLAIYEDKSLRPRSDTRGIPLGGWGKFFHDVVALNARPIATGAKVTRLVEHRTGKRPTIK